MFDIPIDCESDSIAELSCWPLSALYTCTLPCCTGVQVYTGPLAGQPGVVTQSVTARQAGRSAPEEQCWHTHPCDARCDNRCSSVRRTQQTIVGTGEAGCEEKLWTAALAVRSVAREDISHRVCQPHNRLLLIPTAPQGLVQLKPVRLSPKYRTFRKITM